MLKFALSLALGKRLIESLVHEPTPVMLGCMGFSLLTTENLATDNCAAFCKPVHLVCRLTGARDRGLDNRRECLLRGVEHVLAQRARRLE